MKINKYCFQQLKNYIYKFFGLVWGNIKKIDISKIVKTSNLKVHILMRKWEKGLS